MKNIFIFISIFGLLSCKSSQPTAEGESAKKSFIPIELQSGNNGGFKEKSNQIISDQKEFSKIWDQAFVNYMNKESAPEVDFTKNIVLLIALGEKTSGGHTIKVNSIVESNENTIVNILETCPGKGCMTTESITYSYQIVQIEKPNKPIQFSTIEKIIDCDSE